MVPVSGLFHWERRLAFACQENTHDARVVGHAEANWESVVPLAGGGSVAVTACVVSVRIRVHCTAPAPAAKCLAWRFSVDVDAAAFWARVRQDP